jgi:filamentous hemagglutinin
LLKYGWHLLDFVAAAIVENSQSWNGLGKLATELVFAVAGIEGAKTAAQAAKTGAQSAVNAAANLPLKKVADVVIDEAGSHPLGWLEDLIFGDSPSATRTAAVENGAQSPLLHRYLSESGGRWGSTETRQLNHEMASQLENQGYNITGGAGRGSEEYIPGVGPGTRGSTFVDVTASNESKTIRIQTIDTLADGVTPTPAEAAAAARIRAAFPNDELRLIPKPK